MKVKEKLDVMAQEMYKALSVLHERLERIESWMLRQEESKSCVMPILTTDEKKETQKSQ